MRVIVALFLLLFIVSAGCDSVSDEEFERIREEAARAALEEMQAEKKGNEDLEEEDFLQNEIDDLKKELEALKKELKRVDDKPPVEPKPQEIIIIEQQPANAPYQQPDFQQSVPITCSRCRGSGRTQCVLCRGTGNSSSTCTMCRGTGTNSGGNMACTSCKGRRFSTCTPCRGTGMKSCSVCGGSGFI